jgi:hypothetical protein
VTIDQTKDVIKALSGMYPSARFDFENAIKGYHIILGDLEFDDVIAALPGMMTKYPEFMPSAPALRLAVVDGPLTEEFASIPTGEAAFENMWSFVSYPGRRFIPEFDHPLTDRTVAAFGWVDICDSSLEQRNTLRAQFIRLHNDFRATAIADLRRGVPMELAILPHGRQRQIAGLVPKPLPEGDEDYSDEE